MKVAPSNQHASAFIAVLALLGILSLYVMVNARTLSRLKHDVKQIELRQLQRLNATMTSPSAANLITNLPAIGSPPASQVQPR